MGSGFRRDDVRSDYLFEQAMRELDQEHESVLQQLREVLAGDRHHTKARFKSVRFSSTPPPVAIAALRHNIIKNKTAYNKAALQSAKLALKVHVDQIELDMFERAQAESLQDYEHRKASGGLYRGARSFVDWMYEVGVGHHDLHMLDRNEAEQVAGFIKKLIATRTGGDSSNRLPETPS